MSNYSRMLKLALLLALIAEGLFAGVRSASESAKNNDALEIPIEFR